MVKLFSGNYISIQIFIKINTPFGVTWSHVYLGRKSKMDIQ